MANVDRLRLTPTHDRGSVSTEVVLLAPLIVVLALFVVHLGWIANTRLQLISVADQAARAASLVHPRRMAQVGNDVARDQIDSGESRCTAVDVAVELERSVEPGNVTVRLSCTVDPDGLSLLLPIQRTIRVTSSEIIDMWRVDS